MSKIRGRIIRILDSRTVVVNLGEEHGIKKNSIFTIHGKPEKIVDPETKDVLGSVILVKARVSASQVFDKFTIASTRWTQTVMKGPFFNPSNMFGMELRERDEGELKVIPDEISPWKAQSEEPVRVGDTVEVEISDDEPETDEDAGQSDSNDEPEEDESDADDIPF